VGEGGRGDGEEESEEGEENRSEARRRTDPVFYPYSWNNLRTGFPYQRATPGDATLGRSLNWAIHWRIKRRRSARRLTRR